MPALPAAGQGPGARGQELSGRPGRVSCRGGAAWARGAGQGRRCVPAQGLRTGACSRRAASWTARPSSCTPATGFAGRSPTRPQRKVDQSSSDAPLPAPGRLEPGHQPRLRGTVACARRGPARHVRAGHGGPRRARHPPRGARRPAPRRRGGAPEGGTAAASSSDRRHPGALATPSARGTRSARRRARGRPGASPAPTCRPPAPPRARASP